MNTGLFGCKVKLNQGLEGPNQGVSGKLDGRRGVPVCRHAVRDESVLDPFVASGTTVIASEQLGRRCFAMELDPKYCDVVVKRWETYTGKDAERVQRVAPEANP